MISEAMQRYAAEVFRLQEDSEYVGLTVLAAHLDVSTQAAARMVKRMKAAGLVEHEPYRGVRLTDGGERAALPALRKHRLIEVFLVDVMGYDWAQIHDHADVLERGIDEALEERIDALTGHPTHCPHGDPIPTRDGRIERMRDLPLTRLESGSSGTISRVRTHDPEKLRYLEEIGLVPGTDFALLSCAPFEGPLRIRTKDQDLVLGHRLADSVWANAVADRDAATVAGGHSAIRPLADVAPVG